MTRLAELAPCRVCGGQMQWVGGGDGFARHVDKRADCPLIKIATKLGEQWQ